MSGGLMSGGLKSYDQLGSWHSEIQVRPDGTKSLVQTNQRKG